MLMARQAAALAEGQLDEAAALAQQAYEASGAAAALLALGEVLHRQGKPQQAVAAFEQAATAAEVASRRADLALALALALTLTLTLKP